MTTNLTSPGGRYRIGCRLTAYILLWRRKSGVGVCVYCCYRCLDVDFVAWRLISICYSKFRFAPLSTVGWLCVALLFVVTLFIVSAFSFSMAIMSMYVFFAFLYRKDIELAGKPTFDPSPEDP